MTENDETVTMMVFLLKDKIFLIILYIRNSKVLFFLRSDLIISVTSATQKL